MNDSIFVGLDVHKATISVAVTDGMRGGEVRNLGSSAIALIRSTSWRRKLGKGNRQVSFCYEAGPCGYGLHRQLKGLGHNCIVAASSLILIKAWDRVKTDRRNGAMLAKLHRSGELTAVWVPDAAHEAMPDLVSARATAMRVLGKARQHLQGFLLRTWAHLCREERMDSGLSSLAHHIALRSPGEPKRPVRRGGSCTMPG